MKVRKEIKDFITANGTSSEASIIAACVAAGIRQNRVERVLDRLATRGKLIKVGDDYSFPA